MNENEKRFVKAIVDLDANVEKAIDYIKENYNIDCDYNKDESTISLVCNDTNNALNILAAEEYLKEQFDESMLTIV